MKRLATFAAVLVLAACSAKEQKPEGDTAAPAMAPAPAAAPATDSAAMKDSMMKHDSAMKDTTHKP
jgi:uncharacterized lipoprotein YajG